MSRRRKLDPRRVVSYLRVSTDEQHLGPEAQRAAIAAWAARAGVELVAEHVDQGVSGAAPIEERPGLLAAFDDLGRLRAGVLLAAKRDRLARDVVIAGMLERLVEREGACVRTADAVGEGDSPEAAMLRGIVDVFAQYERGLIRSRTKAALAAKARRGERVGQIPYGMRLDAADPRRLIEHEGEQLVIADVVRWHAEGMTMREIAVRLAAEDRPCRGRTFRPSFVCDLLKRARRAA